MAIIHRATLTPSKIELIAEWAPSQPWFRGEVEGLRNVGAYRFDDPQGEVGIETILVRSGDGPVLQIPVTYRGAPLEGAEQWLIGTMEHSVLGRRWVYDGVGDPVYLQAAASAALTGAHEADELVQGDGTTVPRETTAKVVGSGHPDAAAVSLPSLGAVSVRSDGAVTVSTFDGLVVSVIRSPLQGDTREVSGPGRASIAGTWVGQPDPLVLVDVSRG